MVDNIEGQKVFSLDMASEEEQSVDTKFLVLCLGIF